MLSNTLQELRRESKPILQLFFKNIEYLRVKNGLGVIELAEKLSTNDYRVSRASMCSYRSGKYDYAEMAYLFNFARFFGFPLPDLLSRDLRAEEEAKDK